MLLPVSCSCWNMLLVSITVLPALGFIKSFRERAGGGLNGFTSILAAVVLMAPEIWMKNHMQSMSEYLVSTYLWKTEIKTCHIRC